MAGMGPPLGYIRVPLTLPVVADPPGLEVGVGPALGLAEGARAALGEALGEALLGTGLEEVAAGSGGGLNCSEVLSPHAMAAMASTASVVVSQTRSVTDRN
jgi:hypothetical protein